MPEDFSTSPDGPPIISSSSGNDPEVQAKWDNDWKDILSKPVEETPEKESPPSAPVSDTPETRKSERQSQELDIEVPDPEPVKKSTRPAERAPEFEDEPVPAKAETQKSPDPDIESIDSMELHPSASEEQRSQFRQLKDIVKSKSNESKQLKETLRETLRKVGYDQELPTDPAEISKVLDSKLQALRTTDPENEARLAISRASGLERSISYVKMYVEPDRWTSRGLALDLARSRSLPCKDPAVWTFRDGQAG